MKSALKILIVLIVSGAAFWAGRRMPGDTDTSVLVFPDANSRITTFALHHIHEAQLLSRGDGVRIGILDHSFGLKNHPELYRGGAQFVDDDPALLTVKEWHGYWMALTVHEVAPRAEIYALNTYSFKHPDGHAQAIAKAIDWAIDHKLQILTYSHAAIPEPGRQLLNAALDKAHNAGIITVFIHTGHPGNIMPSGLWATPDDGREPDINVLHYNYAVIHTDEYFKLSKGEKSWWNPPFLSVSDTAPVLGGVIALMKSRQPSLSAEDCRRILKQTAFSYTFEQQTAPRTLDALAALSAVALLNPRAGEPST